MTEANRIKILDKSFKVIIPKEKIEERVENIALNINKELEGTNPLFVCMLTGAYIFAADLLRHMNWAVDMRFIKWASYAGLESGEIRHILDLDVDIKGRTIVVVEDIVDTGKTMQHLVNYLIEKGAADVKIATMLFKPNKLKVDLTIDWVGFEIGDEFVVGYGMDYNEVGRNLADIYQLG